MVILLAIIAGHAYFRLDRKEQAQRLFFLLMLLTILILVLEILSVALNGGYYSNLITAHKLVDTIGFALSPLVPVFALAYVYRRANKYEKIANEKVLWCGVPFAVNAILSVGSYYFNWIFTITPENMYVRGPLFFVSPLTFYYYYIVTLKVLYDGRKKLSKEELLMLSMFTIIPGLMSFFQLYYFIYLTIWNSIAIVIIVNYIFIVHSRTQIDQLTGLGNRVAYDEFIARLRGKSNIVLAVVNIDLDNFKSVNDVYGHREGDKVLRFFARQLESIFGEKGVAIRFGGDEFIIFLAENQKSVVEEYIRLLRDRINAPNEANEVTCPIKFSYGITIFNDAYNSIDELIHHSDKLMYEEKQRVRQGN